MPLDFGMPELVNGLLDTSQFLGFDLGGEKPFSFGSTDTQTAFSKEHIKTKD